MVTDALIIIPTHNHPTTISYALESAQHQSISDLEIVVIGDGVGDDTRDIVYDIIKTDSRIRFIDKPKCASRNELTRHQVVVESQSKIITYLGDDDLFLTNHVEIMQRILIENDFTHSCPVYITKEEEIIVHGTNLKVKKWIDFHLIPNQNTISLTGAAHTLQLYKRLPYGWRIAPPGNYSDLYMWQQIFKVPGIKMATSKLSTTIKLGSNFRTSLNQEMRRMEIAEWSNKIKSTGFNAYWQHKIYNQNSEKKIDTSV
jgi:glycosyltransferase involved in cell wall biosynthesis